jgi:hypothetical protein
MTRRSQNKAPRLERCGACFVLSPTAGWRVATVIVLPITRIIGDVATGVYGHCVARRMIWTGLAEAGSGSCDAPWIAWEAFRVGRQRSEGGVPRAARSVPAGSGKACPFSTAPSPSAGQFHATRISFRSPATNQHGSAGLSWMQR